ncbi:MAG: hypothetical protein K6B65_00365 [Bacilli bacterium]|nr:hypothetical protein [Bacilli bacterium]
MIHLLIAGNDYAAKGLLIIVLSYLRSNSRPVTIHFITMDLTDRNPKFKPIHEGQVDYIRKVLKSANKDNELIIHDALREYLSTPFNRKYDRSMYTPYALLRIFADKLDLPDKVLYLDTDTFILKDLSPLFDMDIEGHEFAGAIDQIGEYWISPDYMNSGVLLLNMKEIKKTGLLDKCRDWLHKKHSPLADQSALNYCSVSKVYMDQRYNEQKKTQDVTVIRHFSKILVWFPIFHTRNVKPWHLEKMKKRKDYHYFKEVIEDYEGRLEEFGRL